MSATIDDLKPKNFKVEVKGVELECKPVKMYHALIFAKIGNIFNKPEEASEQQIRQAEADLQKTIKELIPAIDFDLGLDVGLELMQKLMETIQPDDNKELEAKGVKLGTDDPKA